MYAQEIEENEMKSNGTMELKLKLKLKEYLLLLPNVSAYIKN